MQQIVAKHMAFNRDLGGIRIAECRASLNFTYYLKDPVNGDQMLQRDDRVVYGFKASKTWYPTIAGFPMSNVVGVQARIDDIRDVGIFPTFQRQVIGTRQDASVLESSGAVYAESSVRWLQQLRTVVGLREDQFDFDVKDKMRGRDGSCNLSSDPLGCATGNKRASTFSPKLGIVLGPWARTTYFINFADGFHSNDARGVTRSGAAPNTPSVTPLARAISGEVGLATNLVPYFKKSDEWLAALDVFNVFNAKWNDIEYYYVSRLQHQASPQPDYVVHPGVPITARLHFQYFF